ncbi:MAG: alpha/beta fold hydrolase [Sorangiineae bacterium]|nr:alpha/beta fold hydrolase [Polyangiaceae bacterium]MEB2323720.1 alpha/beta fold hydrolase [Sorangiineae bacterium]
MILHSQVVEQAVDVGEHGRFVKELVLARGPVPISLVRKRLAKPDAAVGATTDPDAAAEPTRATVLLIHGYGQNRYAFHLPARSMVDALARAGFDVYNVDLRGRGRSAHFGAPRPGSILEFVHEDVPAALDEVERLSGKRPVFLVGHSLGGVVSYCVAVDHRPRVAGVVSLGSPYHFTLGSRWLAGAGVAFRTLDRHLHMPNVMLPVSAFGKAVRAARTLVDSPLYPFPLRGFHRGSMEPEVLRQHMALAMDRGSVATIRAMFNWASQVRKLGASGEDGVFGYAGRFEALDLPLLVISGTYDDLAPPASVEPAYRLSRSTDKTYRELPFGHIDLLVGRDAPLLTWPLVESWLSQRGGAAAKASDTAAA